MVSSSESEIRGLASQQEGKLESISNVKQDHLP